MCTKYSNIQHLMQQTVPEEDYLPQRKDHPSRRPIQSQEPGSKRPVNMYNYNQLKYQFQTHQLPSLYKSQANLVNLPNHPTSGAKVNPTTLTMQSNSTTQTACKFYQKNSKSKPFRHTGFARNSSASKQLP